MDIFIYNSISLIDLGRRVFGQSALSPCIIDDAYLERLFWSLDTLGFFSLL